VLTLFLPVYVLVCVDPSRLRFDSSVLRSVRSFLLGCFTVAAVPTRDDRGIEVTTRIGIRKPCDSSRSTQSPSTDDDMSRIRPRRVCTPITLLLVVTIMQPYASATSIDAETTPSATPSSLSIAQRVAWKDAAATGIDAALFHSSMLTLATAADAVLAAPPSHAHQSKAADATTCDALSPGFASNLTRPSVCHGVLDYGVLNLGSGACLSSFNSRSQALPTLWALFLEPCRSAVAVFTCVLSHPRCSAPSIPPCANTCSSVSDHCGSSAPTVYAILAAQGFPVDCAARPFDQTNSYPSCNPGPDTLAIHVHGTALPSSPDNITAAIVRPAVPSGEIYTGSVCATILGPNATIYIPFGFAQEAMERFVQVKYAWLFNLAPRAHGCNTLFAQFICAQAFLPCTHLHPLGSAGPSTVLPRPLCQGRCEEFVESCTAAGLFKGLPQLKPNCTSRGSLFPATKDCAGTIIAPSGGDDFPRQFADFGAGFRSRCNDYVTDQDGVVRNLTFTPHATASCPTPLVVPDNSESIHSIGGGLCATPCPILIISDAMYSRADIVLIVVVIASFVLSFFTLMSWLTDPHKRSQHYIVFFILFTLLLAFWQLVQIIVWWRTSDLPHLANTFCADNTDIVDREHFWTNSLSTFGVIVAAIQIYNIHAIGRC
jgi:hypothetical protein